MNIPIYRAKKINSDEWVEGDLQCGYNCDVVWVWTRNGNDAFEVDPSTLAIHFPNMIDKNGTKIFASLNDNGIGGDELRVKYKNANIKKLLKHIAVYHENKFSIYSQDGTLKTWDTIPSKFIEIDRGQVMVEYVEVIGIHKG